MPGTVAIQRNNLRIISKWRSNAQYLTGLSFNVIMTSYNTAIGIEYTIVYALNKGILSKFEMNVIVIFSNVRL